MKTRPDQQGFALVAALWMVALLALAASMLALWVGRATEEARQLRQRVAEEIELADAKAAVLFSFMVDPLSGRGLETASSLEALRAVTQLAISQPFDRFLHFHGGLAGHDHAHHHAARGDPLVVEATFPCPGLYRLWVQVRRDGAVVTAPFVVEALASSR